MKLHLPSLLLTLALSTSTLAATDYENASACAGKNPNTNAAISAFCNIINSSGNYANNMVVPSPYTTNGVAKGGIRVKITGTCSPKQWVPIEYCQPQFHAMCANGGPKDGLAKKQFGRNGCQTWIIEKTGGSRIGGIIAGLGRGG